MSDIMATDITQTERSVAVQAIIPGSAAQQTVYVVLPAYNEQDALAPLLDSIRVALTARPGDTR